MTERLAHGIIRRRRIVFAVWIVLTLIGAGLAGGIADRLSQQFSIPGYSAYEANQRIFKDTHTGKNYPLVPVFHSGGDVTKAPGLAPRIEAVAKVNPGSRVSSYFNTGGNPVYVSKDRHTMFAEIYPPGAPSFNGLKTIPKARAALKQGLPAGVTANLTGQQPLQDASGQDQGSSIGLEIAIGGVGALIVLMFVFGTLPAVAMPLMIAAASILNTYTLITLLTTVTQVSVIVQFLVALVGLGVAIDYSLLMIFRFREELAAGRDRETAVVETMKHAGRAVIVSGSTVAIGLLSLVVLPLPFIRSIGIAGMLIPAVSVIAAVTLLPAMLYVLGPRINRLRVMPKRLVTTSDDAEAGFWARWSQIVLKRPLAVASAGLAIVAALVAFGVQLNPAEAQAKDLPGKGDAIAGRQALTNSGISLSAVKPFNVLIEKNASPEAVKAVIAKLDPTSGVTGAAAPTGRGWRGPGYTIVESFANVDASSKPARGIIDNLQSNTLPAVANQVDRGTQITLAGQAPEDRDFVHAVYGKFPLMFAFVIVLTFLLLARAFRSLILPLKAVVLNLLSLAAAYGIIVIIFQKGFGSEALWNVHATQSIISWIPLMIFAFLYGISMDYEVFMLTRMREAYDEGLETHRAVAKGLARTGKLVTSGALILALTFFVLSTGPGVDIKQFGVGLAAGIIFDATVIRALLVPALMELLGKWNWWLPKRAAKLLMLRPAAESAG
jgi:RND superfamily putative drug exporter